jgi:hypothetical protein
MDLQRFTIIDPMHNLYLGTAKRIMKKWTSGNQPLISIHDLKNIQAIINATPPPSDIGRIPFKIASQFAGFTADQWKSWCLIYSTLALRNILSEEHRQYWQSFIDCLSLWGQTIVTYEEIVYGDLAMKDFLIKIKSVWGPEIASPNMHMHLHIKDCMLDYGPLYSFWCFPFERLNG